MVICLTVTLSAKSAQISWPRSGKLIRADFARSVTVKQFTNSNSYFVFILHFHIVPTFWAMYSHVNHSLIHPFASTMYGRHLPFYMEYKINAPYFYVIKHTIVSRVLARVNTKNTRRHKQQHASVHSLLLHACVRVCLRWERPHVISPLITVKHNGMPRKSA